MSEVYDFYSPSNINLNDIDDNLKSSLSVMTRLDDLTLQHCKNVSNLTTRICQHLHYNNKFTEHCMITGYVHDVGKLFVPKEILFKPGRLTSEEFDIIKKHTTYGYEYCMKDPYLAPYSDGPWYHHEALNGTGYPRGLKGNDIPLSGQIIRVADEYDALVTKRHYKTHVNISETLKDLIKGAEPPKQLVALDAITQNERMGKINPKPLRVLFNVVIDDVLYEISCVMNYTDYLKSQIKRLEKIEKYNDKRLNAKKEADRAYNEQLMNYYFQNGENLDNYLQVKSEYELALQVREKRIEDLYKEIKIIKKLKI